jgi:hypothetical protein
MDSLGEEEKKYREEQMKVEGEMVVAAYYGREKGEMALELRRAGAGIREWEELGRARESQEQVGHTSVRDCSWKGNSGRIQSWRW